MINNFNFFNLQLFGNNQNLRSYLVFAYFLLFFSVGENIVNIKFNQNILELKNTFYIRAIAPYLILIINFILIVRLKVINVFTSNRVLIFFYLIFLFQSLGLLFSENREYLALVHFLVGTLATLTLFNIILWFNENKLISQLLSITIFFFVLIVIIFIYQNPNISYGGGSIVFFGKEIYYLNSNGFSRYLLFIYIFIFSKTLIETKIYNLKYLLILIFISSLIIAYEGRVNILSLLTINLFIFFNKLEIKDKLKFFILIIIIPIFFSNIVKNFQTYQKEFQKYGVKELKKYDVYSQMENFILEINTSTNRLKNVDDKVVPIENYFEHITSSVDNFTTGRINKWIEIIKHKQKPKNYIFGNGPEFDRFILQKRQLQKFGNDSASAILYLYLCGGLISLFFLLIFGIYQFYLFYFAILKIKKTDDVYFLISLKLFIFLAIRSFFENSFAYWGIDQILFILTAIYWNSYVTKKLS